VVDKRLTLKISKLSNAKCGMMLRQAFCSCIVCSIKGPTVRFGFLYCKKRAKIFLPFALADADTLGKSFSQAGFKDIKIDTFQITFEFDSPDSYTRAHQQTNALIHAMLAKYTDEVKKHVWDSITEAVWQYADSHGRVNLDNEVICIVGKN
jgi:hypothetical protein